MATKRRKGHLAQVLFFLISFLMIMSLNFTPHEVFWTMSTKWTNSSDVFK